MPPVVDDDWSDSDEEALGEQETDVLLGVPDGPIGTHSDLLDAAVSRIGGLPVRTFHTCQCTFILLNSTALLAGIFTFE